MPKEIITHHLALKLDSNNGLYLKISKITEEGNPYDITLDTETNHPIFGFPLNHIKIGDLFIIKKTTKPGTQEFKITPVDPHTYHLLINNEVLKYKMKIWKKWNIHPEKIEAIENLTAILREIQLNKLI